MIPNPDLSEERLAQLKEGLKRAGVKLTHQRLEIFRELVRSGDHPDAETIFRGVRERVPMVSLDTVYRTLWLLVDLGLITTLGPPKDRVRFDANMLTHHHFVCTMCGATHDFYCNEFDRLNLPLEVEELGTVNATQVEAKGLCLDCARKRDLIKSE